MSQQPRKLLVALAAVAATSALLAGCSAPAPGGSGTGPSSDGFDVSAYAEATEQALAGPTSFEGPTEQVTPPKDVTLAIITCASFLAGCLQPAEAAQQAATDVGWDATVYDGKVDPGVQNQLILQAVNSGVDAIITVAIDPSFIATGLEAAHQANIPVGSISQGVAPSDTGYVYDVGPNWKDVGVIQGSWIVSDSAGKAVLLPLMDREYASTVMITDAAIEVVKSCSTCEVLPYEDFVSATVGSGLGPRVAGLVRQNPAISYIYGSHDPAAADIANGLANAGLISQAKIMGVNGQAESFQSIRDGKQAATVALDLTYSGYAAIDQMIRTLLGEPLIKIPDADEALAYGENVPTRLFTAENIGDVQGDRWTADVDTVANFHKVWGLG